MQGVPEALFYEPLPDQRGLCTLCPHDCHIAAGGRGACGVRYNDGGKLYTLVYELSVWVEVTTLVVPGLNDSAEELHQIAEFICSVGPEIPWHVTPYYPAYKMWDRPPTPVETLQRAAAIGRDAGLRYVYQGNIPGEGGENTYCHRCQALLIDRYGLYG